MPQRVERKLTTILCADVEGYSRLMDHDEVSTLETLKRHRDAFTGLIERHRGRVVNTWGDGLIAEFPSVVEAVLCAVETQKELGARNAGLPPERRLDFRVGINLGDVMVEGQDLYGEGVNVAARLQGLADPGGIVISGTVHDQVRGKLVVAYEFAGTQHVKNIAEPVPAFRVKLDAVHEPARSRWWRRRSGGQARTTDRNPAVPMSPGRPPGRRWLFIGLALIAFFFLVNMFSNAEEGSTEIWFHWPSLLVGFVMALRWAWKRG
jgi:adenylate cyclase